MIKVVKEFTYRSALVARTADAMILNREIMKCLESVIGNTSNHTVYVVTGMFGDENKQVAINFTDYSCVVGSKIVKWDGTNHSATKNVCCELAGDF